MNRSKTRWLVLAFFVLAGGYSLIRFELTHSLTHFIPKEHKSELVELSLELVQSPISRQMILSIGGGPNRDDVATALGEYLDSHPEVLWVGTRFDEESIQTFFDLYFDRRMYLVSGNPSEEVPELFEEQALARSAKALKIRLSGPMASAAARTAPRDPLGFFDRIIERVRASQSARLGEGGNFVSLDGQYAIVFLELRSSPFDSERQKPLLRDLEAEFARLNDLYGGSMTLEQSGVNRVSVATERSVRSDVSFVSTASISLVCGFFLLLFRSFRQLIVVIMAPAAGFLAALAISLSLPAPLHGITLAFGFVLIGVAIDYPIHVINHHALRPGSRSIGETMRKIRPSLMLSAVTTTLAFLALAFSDFPGLREMGVFAAIGVPASLVFAVFGLPAFVSSRTGSTPAQEFLSRTSVRVVKALGHQNKFLILTGIGVAIVLAIGLSQLRWEDDPSDLMTPDPRYLAESERVRKRVSNIDGGKFVLGRARDRESALALNDEIYARLEGARLAGEIEAMTSLHTFLWSEKLQLQNLSALQGVDDRGARIDHVFAKWGFRQGSFDDFAVAIDSPLREPLRVEDLENSTVGRTTNLLLEANDGYAVITYLRGVSSPDGVRRRLADLDNAEFIDRKEIVSGVYRGYRRSTLWLVALGSVVAFCVLLGRYRDPALALLAYMPAAIGTLGALAVFGIAGHPVNVIAAVSLLVVLGMGVDYGIFCVDSAKLPDGPGPTLSSLLISCLTSIFVFGALAFSDQTALNSVGLTPAVGISLALLASPAAIVLAQDHVAKRMEAG